MSTLRAILPAAPLSPDDTYTLEHRVIHNADVDALTTLFVSNRACIFGLVVRYVRDANEAESLVQETYLQAITCIHRFRGDSKVSTWLCAIALNLARAHVRKPCTQTQTPVVLRGRCAGAHPVEPSPPPYPP